ERAIGVLGHADDAGDVHASIAEGGGDPRQRARPVLELDREPDHHRAGTSCSAMVAPGYPPAMAGPSVQVFGTPDSPATRAALRFFKERRIDVHFVDVSRKSMAPAELRRFID